METSSPPWAGRPFARRVLPRPGSLSTVSCPSMSAISRAAMVRPRPVPPYFRVVDVSSCSKARKIAACFSRGTPMPVSRTEKRSQASSSDGAAPVRGQARELGSANQDGPAHPNAPPERRMSAGLRPESIAMDLSEYAFDALRTDGCGGRTSPFRTPDGAHVLDGARDSPGGGTPPCRLSATVRTAPTRRGLTIGKCRLSRRRDAMQESADVMLHGGSASRLSEGARCIDRR